MFPMVEGTAMKRPVSVLIATVAAVAAGGAAVCFAGSASAAVACAAAWNSGTVYVGGNAASQSGHNYTAKWWTQNESPATHSGQWDVWADNGACGGGTTPPTTPPPTTAPPPTTPPPTTPPPTTPPPTTPPPSNGTLPAHILTGYWHNFTNPAQEIKLAAVPANYDLVAVAFATATSTPGAVSFSVDPGLSSSVGGYTNDQFKADVATLHGRGKKVILSVGGETGTVSVGDSGAATNFANSVYSLMQSYGFDGVDIDLENGVNPTWMGSALRSLRGKAGANLIITMAPQTIDMQSPQSSYFALALNIKDILTVVNTQFYNSGSMLGCDNNQAYSQGTVNFIVALACIQLQNGLRPDQVGLGLPATSSAAGGGYVAPSVVNAALDCLARGTNCGTFKPPATYPGIRGAMTWSINWDVTGGNTFANTVKPHLSTLP
jgi:chitinase